MSSKSNFINCDGAIIKFTEVICSDFCKDDHSYGSNPIGDCKLVFKNGAIVTVRMCFEEYKFLIKKLLGVDDVSDDK